MDRVKRTLIALFLMGTLVAAPLRAESGPVDPTVPTALPAPSAVQNFIELQKLTELLQQPDWLLAIGGIGIGFWGAQKLVGTLVETITKTLPSAARYYRLLRAYNTGLRAVDRLEKLPAELEPFAIEAKKRSVELAEWIKKFPRGTLHRGDILDKPLDEIEALLKKKDTVNAVRSTKKGNDWLVEYEHRKLAYDAALSVLIEKFSAGAEEATTFSKWSNQIAQGLLGTPELAQRETHYRVVANPRKGPGAILIYMDGGFLAEVEDPRLLPAYTHAPLTKCNDLLAKLGVSMNRARVQIEITSLLKPLSQGAAVGIGAGLYSLGASRIGKNHHGEAPEQILQKQRARVEANAQATALRDVLRGGDLSATAKVFGEIRADEKKSPVPAEIYRIFRDSMRARLPKMAQDVRDLTDKETRDELHFEENTERFLKDDEWANRILDSAIAEAALNEAKVGTPDRAFEILLSHEDADQIQTAVFLARHFSSATKFLWRDVKIEGAAYPVRPSQVAGLVNETMAGLEEIRQKRRAAAAKAKAPTTSSTGATQEGPAKFTGEIPFLDNPNRPKPAEPIDQELTMLYPYDHKRLNSLAESSK